MQVNSLSLASELLGLEESTSHWLQSVVLALSGFRIIGWLKLLLWPWAFLYLGAPRWGTSSSFSLGGWAGSDPWDICAELTAAPSEYWRHQPQLCLDLLSRRFYSWVSVWLFLLILWALRRFFLPACCRIVLLMSTLIWSLASNVISNVISGVNLHHHHHPTAEEEEEEEDGSNNQPPLMLSAKRINSSFIILGKPTTSQPALLASDAPQQQPPTGGSFGPLGLLAQKIKLNP